MPWYYLQDNETIGPVGLDELQHLADQGLLTDATAVIEEGASAWTNWGQVRYRQSVGLTDPSASPELTSTSSSFCSQCGLAHSEDQMMLFQNSWICPTCKPIFLQRFKEGVSPASSSQFAGFWIRLLARLIDGLIMAAASMILVLPFNLFMQTQLQENPEEVGFFLAGSCLLQIVQLAINLLYEAWFLKNHGATPGKMALGLKVYRSEGDSLTWGRSIGRYFGYLLSSFTLGIGFIIAGFDDEKRTLHDHICDTRVLRNQ